MVPYDDGGITLPGIITLVQCAVPRCTWVPKVHPSM